MTLAVHRCPSIRLSSRQRPSTDFPHHVRLPALSGVDVYWTEPAVTLLRQDDTGGVVGRGVLRARVAEAHRIDAGEEVLAPAQNHGGDRGMDLVDQPSGEVLANGGNATAESGTSLPWAASFARSSAAWMP